VRLREEGRRIHLDQRLLLEFARDPDRDDRLTRHAGALRVDPLPPAPREGLAVDEEAELLRVLGDLPQRQRDAANVALSWHRAMLPVEPDDARMRNDTSVRIRRLSTSDLGSDEVHATRALLDEAFGDDPDERFGENDWQHALGGTQVVLNVDGAIVGRAAVVGAPAANRRSGVHHRVRRGDAPFPRSERNRFDLLRVAPGRRLEGEAVCRIHQPGW
jgi:hypothetical protein